MNCLADDGKTDISQEFFYNQSPVYEKSIRGAPRKSQIRSGLKF